MDLKRITLALAAVCSIPAGSALASPLRAEPVVEMTALPDISLEQGRVRDALNGLALDLAGQRVAIGRRGRHDMVFESAKAPDAVFGTLKSAYLGRRVLRHNLRVAGWAFIDARQSWTFTIEDADTLDSWVAEVAPSEGGTRVIIAGVAQRWRAPASTMPHIPRRGDVGLGRRSVGF